MSLAEFVVIAVLVGSGCMLGYVGLWFMLRQAATDRHEAAKIQLSALTGALRAIEAKVAELSQLAAAAPEKRTRLTSKLWKTMQRRASRVIRLLTLRPQRFHRSRLQARRLRPLRRLPATTSSAAAR